MSRSTMSGGMTDWWRQRSARERLSLTAAGVLLLVVALALALEPLAAERRRLSAGLPGLQADLAWMQAHVAEVEQLRQSAATAEQAPAPARLSAAQVEALLHEAGLREQVSALQPQIGAGINAGDGAGITIGFTEIGFADLLALMLQLQDTGRARVTALRVQAGDARNGQVTAELTLSTNSVTGK